MADIYIIDNYNWLQYFLDKNINNIVKLFDFFVF